MDTTVSAVLPVIVRILPVRGRAGRPAGFGPYAAAAA